MYSNLRSLIFKIDPERAHFLAIQSLKLNLVSNIFDENKNDPILKTKLFNQNLDNPIGIAAGFDKNAEVYNPLFKLGFGFVEVGTVTPLKQYGNEKPRVFRLVEDQALINRLGFNNHGSDTILNRIKSNKKLGVLGVNVGPNKDSNDRLNDYLIGLEKFSEVADYITINISSPNTENLRNFHESEKLDELLNLIDEEKKNLKSKTPLVVKISPDILDEEALQICNILLKYDKIDGFISNAGNGAFQSLENFSPLQIDQFVKLNLTSHIILTRALIPHLKKRKSGNIIFIGSESALNGKKYGSLYSSCKFGLRGFSQSIREECANNNIKVTIVNPGMVNTPFFKKLDFSPGKKFDEFIESSDVAKIVLDILNFRDGTVIDEINLSPLKKVIKFKK